MEPSSLPLTQSTRPPRRRQLLREPGADRNFQQLPPTLTTTPHTTFLLKQQKKVRMMTVRSGLNQWTLTRSMAPWMRNISAKSKDSLTMRTSRWMKPLLSRPLCLRMSCTLTSMTFLTPCTLLRMSWPLPSPLTLRMT